MRGMVHGSSHTLAPRTTLIHPRALSRGPRLLALLLLYPASEPDDGVEVDVALRSVALRGAP